MKKNDPEQLNYAHVLIYLLIETFWYSNIFESRSDMDIFLSTARASARKPIKEIPEQQLLKMGLEIGACCAGDYITYRRVPVSGSFLPVHIKQFFCEGAPPLEPPIDYDAIAEKVSKVMVIPPRRTKES